MSILPVSPTRMELTRLKKQLQLSERGHKLLKDKQDELMRQFIAIIKETQQTRRKVEQQYRTVRHTALLAKTPFDEKAVLINAFDCAPDNTFSLKTVNQMGVFVPVMEFSSKEKADWSSLSLSPALNDAKIQMQELFPLMLKLAQLEKHCVILSEEIEKTRRRVNALEYMTIPQLKETIRFIKMRLEDSERDGITRIIKMQDYDISSVTE